jgi:hypothetical protein
MLEACFTGRYTQGVPQRLSLDGPPDEIVPVQVRMPRWRKQKAAAAAEASGKDLKDWVNDAIQEKIDREKDKRSPRARR